MAEEAEGERVKSRTFQADETLAQRFERQAQKPEDPDGCWLWTGERIGDMRYGGILDGPKPYKYAHRVSWELHLGPIPPSRLVLHSCDVPHCVNPEHLWLGTQKQNIHDMIRKGRQGWRRKALP